MYVPPRFQADPAAALAVVEAHAFGLLVSRSGGRLVATHAPLVLERGPEGEHELLGHVARANPQWRDLPGQEILCVFQGPHAHISPTWYASAPAVPTWDYVAAHVYGRAGLIEDEAEALAVLGRLTRTFEGDAWRLEDQPERFRASMMKGLVAFRVRDLQIEGSLKLSQNRSAADRAGVIEGLGRRGSADDLAVARLVEEAGRELP